MRRQIAFCILLVVCLTGCQQKKSESRTDLDGNAVYYWRTTFSLNNYEQDFLKAHQIKRLYIRFFDVILNPDTSSSEICVPSGTILFKSSVPNDLEIIPVVFITPEAIKQHEKFTSDLAHRIHAMCQYNNIKIKEVQFDCDWTTSTRDSYFQFLKNVKIELKKYIPDVDISATIRLHQLSQTPPEVKYGTLMCYNTGDFKDFDTHNAILDIEDVRPYLTYLKDYPLPLTLALPDYDWNVEFSENREFLFLNRHTFDFSDKQQFRKTDRENVYEQLKNGQTQKYIRHESVSANSLLKVKKAVRKSRKENMPVTLYHLDSIQLSKYTDNEIEKIYR